MTFSRIGIAALLVCSTLVAAGDEIIYAEPDALDAYWKVAEKFAPVYPRSAQRRGVQGCVTISYVIEADGTTSTHRPIVMMPSDVFTDASVEATKAFRYDPAPGNSTKQAVLTYNTFTFVIDSPGKERSREMDQQCQDAAREKMARFSGSGH